MSMVGDTVFIWRNRPPTGRAVLMRYYVCHRDSTLFLSLDEKGLSKFSYHDSYNVPTDDLPTCRMHLSERTT